MSYEIAAFSAALVWSLTGIISMGPAKLLGGFGFNRLRIIFVAIMICAVVLYRGGWHFPNHHSIIILSLSGLIGIMLGDSLLFSALKRVGPRINSILYAMNAPIATVLSYFFLSERLSFSVFFGCILMTTGVVIAIANGRNPAQIEVRHNTIIGDGEQRNLKSGILFGLGAALCQAVGALIVKPILLDGAIDPIEGASIRISAAAFLMLFTYIFYNDLHKLKLKDWFLVLLSGFLGIGIGMTLVLYALIGGELGVVMTLSSLSPVLILPLLWLFTGSAPKIWAWGGAIIAAFGSALVFMF